MTDEDKSLLEEDGWEIECISPLEIYHPDTGSVATERAAKMVIEYLKADIREDS